MPIPLRQGVRVAAHLLKQKVAGRKRFALLVEIEPLFACNLSCAGCGKIQHPVTTLRRRLTREEIVAAVEECGAPMVSIAGGEPLLHDDLAAIVDELVRRKRFVYVCTNGVLLRRRLEQFSPSPYFAWVVHIDGMRERHDEIVCRPGVFDEAVEAIRAAKDAGFRVTTNSTFFDTDSPKSVRDVLTFLNDDLRVDSMMITPGYAYDKAPDQDHFLPADRSRRLFREAFGDGFRRRWRLNHTPAFLDFLEGKLDLDCTAWAIPSYSVLGWQRPCYLMADGYVSSYRELIDETDWTRYGRGKDPRCANCMAHCGYEPSAVLQISRSPRQALRALTSR